MPSSIPIEIIYLFIEASRDWMPTLLQFALVSKECMVESRKYAFERVKLGQSLPSPDFNCRQIKKLHALMTANIALGTYIRHLDLGMESICIDDNHGLHELSAILLRLPALASLSFSSGEWCRRYRCQYDWNGWPSPLKASIERCCSSPTITTLHFADIVNFPDGLLTLSPNLEVLILEQIGGVAESPDELRRPVTQRTQRQSLKTLSIAGGWSVASCVLVAPQSFSSITKLHWDLSEPEEVFALDRVAWEIPRSLQELSIQFSFCFQVIPSDIEDPDFPATSIRQPPPAHLFLAGQLLQSQRELEVFLFKCTVCPPEIDIGTTGLAIPPDIQPRCDGWKLLDELLSGLRKPPTIIFHFTAFWIPLPSSRVHVTHDLKAAFKDWLMQEAENVLCQSMEAGALTIVLDETTRYLNENWEVLSTLWG